MRLHESVTKRGLALLVGGVVLRPALAAGCSFVEFAHVRWPGSAVLIARATPDTLHAGPGLVQFRSGGGAPRFYGQVVEVEVAGGWARGRVTDGAKAVLVPWAYDAACRTLPWTDAARWVEPGVRGLFMAILRDSAQWVNGLPTFDVHAPFTNPYPSKSRPGRRTADSTLTIEELLEVLELRPLANEARSSPYLAFAPLRGWARSHPDLARKEPARQILGIMAFTIEQALLDARVPAVSGTWQLTITAPDTVRTLFLRTMLPPTDGWPPVADRKLDPLADPVPPQGVYLLVSVASREEELPVVCAERSPGSEGYVAVLDGRLTEDGWDGKIELDVLTALFGGDSTLALFESADQARMSARMRAGQPFESPARFRRATDGTFTVEQRMVLDDSRVLSITGVRRSGTTVRCTRR